MNKLFHYIDYAIQNVHAIKSEIHTFLVQVSFVHLTFEYGFLIISANIFYQYVS